MKIDAMIAANDARKARQFKAALAAEGDDAAQGKALRWFIAGATSAGRTDALAMAIEVTASAE